MRSSVRQPSSLLLTATTAEVLHGQQTSWARRLLYICRREMCIRDRFKLGAEVTSVKALKAEGYTDVIVSIGAWKPGRSPLAYGEVTDALEFLMEAKKNGASMNIGKDVVCLLYTYRCV